jgi:hypothetical protein
VLASIRQTLTTHGLATDRDVDELGQALEDAKPAEYISAFSNLYVEMIAEVP